MGRTVGDVKGVIVCGGDGKPERVIEEHLIRKDGKKEITFISEERKQELKSRNHFEKYINQFEIIEGKDKKAFLKEDKLNINRNNNRCLTR